MNGKLSSDLSQMDAIFEETLREAKSFLAKLPSRVVSHSDLAEQKPNALPQEGIGASQTLRLFKDCFDPLLVASGGPRYWGYVTGGATPASLLGDWLASTYDQNTQTMNGEGDISGRIEKETIQLLLDLFQLPKSFLGGFVTGATMSNFTGLAVGRQWLGRKLGRDIAKQGICEPLTILTANAHSSAVKSLAMLGIGRDAIQEVAIASGNREAICLTDLKEKIASLEGKPFILISSAGTVNTVDFDDFRAIAKLKEEHHFWWHIDAAFGAFAACSPQTRHLIDGWESADSITIDCHKWLNVPYDSAIFLVRNEHRHLQVETFQNSSAPYLGDPLENFNYLNFLPENSRRLRALPTWFSLMAYGKKGYQDIVDNCVSIAKKLGDFIEASPEFKLLAPVRLNTVCFKPNLVDSSEFLKRLNASGRVFMTATRYQGESGVRAALVNWRTTDTDLAIAIEEIQKALKES